MQGPHSLDRIVVVPRNGYVNRLQAWASAAILGAELDVPVQVLWEPEPIAPATAEQLFASKRVRMSFVDPASLTADIGMPHEQWPRHLTVRGDVAFLAGHDLGEQHFMPELVQTLSATDGPSLLVIVAGGKFHLPGAAAFDMQRRVFYSRIEWNETIRERVARATTERGTYAGLHIRQTDRSVSAPTPSMIRSAVTDLGVRTRASSLFVAADTAQASRRWQEEARALGMEPWSLDDIDFDRAREQAGIDAIVDWLVLGQAEGIVYSKESSFGQEAAVRTSDPQHSIALSASAGRQRARGIGAVARSAVTYPARRLRRAEV